jgi:hypothetical protein
MAQSSTGSTQIVRKLLPYSTAAAVLALLYLAWVFYSRWTETRDAQRAAAEKEAEQSRKTYELYGSGQLKLMLFYASPPVVAKGGSTQLCYSVSNAANVKIEPDVEPIKPSLSRCVAVKPVRSTTYTITASDDKGHQSTKTVDVVVR